MKELLEWVKQRNDIRHHSRVINAFISMDHVCLYHHWDSSSNRAILLSIESLAFYMRDVCISRDIGGQKTDWTNELGKITGNDDSYNLMLSDPVQWVCAAVIAWERSK